MKKSDDPYVQLAIDTIDSYVRKHEIPEVETALPELLERQAACFVSLKKDGNLRGCIGTISPYYDNLATEIVMNAISASTRDPRFSPVTPDELDEISYSVDVLGDPEQISSLDELNPKQYGVIVTSPGKSGVLLPDLEGVDTVEQQLDIAIQKAGILPSREPITIYRFEVIRHVE